MSARSGDRVAAVILAAGRGTRFGDDPKLLAPLDGKPLVRHVGEAALASRARPVCAVLGHVGAQVRQALDGLDIAFVDNPAYAQGLSTSLKAGFAAATASADAAVVLLADMPLVRADLIDRLVARWAEAARKPLAIVPTFKGRRGNPVLLSGALGPEIAALAGDHGAGPLLRRCGDHVIELAVDDLAVLADIDTPEALQTARSPP